MTISSKTRSLTVLAVWVVACLTPGVVTAGELVENGSFETGDFGPYWVHGAYRGNNYNPSFADHVVVPDMPFTGSYSTRLGFKDSREKRSAVGFIYQDVVIPASISNAFLRFKIRQQGYDTDPFDPFSAQIRDVNDNILATVMELTFTDPSYVFKDSGWMDGGFSPAGYDLTAYAGRTVRVYFEQANTNDNLYETWAYVDDVSVIFRKFVDLFVDTDGDDAFGDPGSGEGGRATGSTLAGDTLTFDLDVQNEGMDTDSYLLSIVGPAGWIVWLEGVGGAATFPHTTAAIAPGDVEHYRVFAVPPVGTAAGSYDIVLDAVSSSFGNRFDSVGLGVNVVDGHYGVDLTVDGNGFGVTGDDGNGGFALKVGQWDETVSYSVDLWNSGNTPTAYTVSVTGDPGASNVVWYDGTPHTASFETALLPVGGRVTMILDVTVAHPQPGGDYRTIVRASALPDTLKMDSIKASLRLQAPRVDMIIGANGNDIYDDSFSGLGGASSNAGERGVDVYFPVTVQNESNQADSFELSWVRPTGNWSAVIVSDGVEYAFPFTTPTIPANSQMNLYLKIPVPANAKTGTYTSLLNAISNTDGRIAESVSAAVSVTDEGQIDMIIDGSGEGVFGPVGTGLGGSASRTLAPGDSVTFVVELRNLSGANSMDISWNTPAGWRVTFDGRTSPVNGYPEGVYDLEVVVPPGTFGGTFDIIVDAEKTERRFYQDSVIGRIHVTSPMIVDAVIDGNGDGIYGALGTGLGGFSTQTHSVPALLSYTIELQNEGTDADEYTIVWNEIPFWQATLNGAVSPYSTVTVAAGSFALLTFEVTVPSIAFPGDHSYIIDVSSNADGNVVESVEARVSIVGPPRADLVIDGNGLALFGPIGSGDGGQSVRAANAGTFYISSLEVWNVGSFADSFLVFWQTPPGWPAGSIVISDGVTNHGSPFWTPAIGAGASLSFTVEVQVPAGVGAGSFRTIIDSHSSLAPHLPESVELITQTSAVIVGTVFDDRDHDGSFGAQDVGIGGVHVTEVNGGLTQITTGDGRFTLQPPGGAPVLVTERNLSGYVSISPDTTGPVLLNAGDTLTVLFADVPGIRLSSGGVRNGVAGAYVDFPHRLDAGTEGAISLSAAVDSGVVTIFLLDENENGLFDGADRAIESSDLDMDPQAGADHLALLVRVFVPMSSMPGTTHQIRINAVQSITGTPLFAEARATDAVVVIENATGQLALQKQVDTDAVEPGGVLTYTVSFTNTGVDSVQNILVFDPISTHVDPIADAFGPGLDVEWRKNGSTVSYLTLDPDDSDECGYSTSERLIRLTFSRNTPYLLAPGETGELTYKVIVK